MPRDRDLVAQIHAIKRRVLPSGKVSFDAERNARGHADKFWYPLHEDPSSTRVAA
jgi:phage FluMu gp28-like protein